MFGSTPRAGRPLRPTRVLNPTLTYHNYRRSPRSPSVSSSTSREQRPLHPEAQPRNCPRHRSSTRNFHRYPHSPTLRVFWFGWAFPFAGARPGTAAVPQWGGGRDSVLLGRGAILTPYGAAVRDVQRQRNWGVHLWYNFYAPAQIFLLQNVTFFILVRN